MKVIDNCKSCGKKARKVSVEIPKKDRDTFINFTDNLNRSLTNTGRADSLFIPQMKYTGNGLLIPSPGESPCQHCKVGEESIGPKGCGRGEDCLPLIYFQINTLNKSVDTTGQKALENFVCDAQAVTWLGSKKKKDIASSVVMDLPLPSQTFSETVNTSSLAQFDHLKSKLEKSLKKRSIAKVTHSAKPAQAQAKVGRISSRQSLKRKR